MSISATNQFYVYVYLDPRKPGNFIYNEYHFDYEPFYVGKGTNSRIHVHLYEYNLENDKNKLKVNKIKKIRRETEKEPIRLIYKENLSEQDAFNLETKTIQTIGRKDLCLGPLTNLTNGGEGISGYKFTKKRIGKDAPNFGNHHSEKTKIQMSESNSGENNSMYNVHRFGQDAPFHNKHHTKETKDKISKNRKNRKKGEKHPRNIYNFTCSDYKDYWKNFSRNEQKYICQKFKLKNFETIIYKGITITRKLKNII